MVGYCLSCGKPLPKDSMITRKYCDAACRKRYHRHKKNPSIREKAKVPPNPSIPDDPTQLTIGQILQLNLPPTLRKAVLDLKTKVEEQDRELSRLQSEDEWKEERVLDERTAKEVARFLAQKHQPS